MYSPNIDWSRRSSSENRLHVPPQCSADPPTAMVREMIPCAAWSSMKSPGHGIFGVLDGALAVRHAVLGVEQPLAGLDYGDGQRRPQFGKLQRQHGRGNAAANDAHIRFVARHQARPFSGAGACSEPSRPRHKSRPMAA